MALSHPLSPLKFLDDVGLHVNDGRTTIFSNSYWYRDHDSLVTLLSRTG